MTGVPIKFIGTGEHLDDLEPFRPEGMAGRILGLGDILGLVDVARQVVDEKQQEELERKLQEGTFTLDDFKSQIESMAQPGLVKKMLGMLGGPMAQLNTMLEDDETEGGMRRTIGIINSMTALERRDPSVISSPRRNRIAQGAGVQGGEVTQLIKQYEQMKPMMEGMAGKGMKERMKAVKELQDGAMGGGMGGGTRQKKSTGTRLRASDKKKKRKDREKILRQSRRRRR